MAIFAALAAPWPDVRRARLQLNSVAGLRCVHADYLDAHCLLDPDCSRHGVVVAGANRFCGAMGINAVGTVVANIPGRESCVGAAVVLHVSRHVPSHRQRLPVELALSFKWAVAASWRESIYQRLIEFV